MLVLVFVFFQIIEIEYLSINIMMMMECILSDRGGHMHFSRRDKT